MPDPRIKTLTNESSTSDEVSKLEIYLQQRLEEDIARIFDESIYSDFEVVCGKSKILTHSCILKARTNQFFHKLEAILHVNIDRNTFEEIYSYISDAYTECDIKNQENEILAFLKKNVTLFKTSPVLSNKRKEAIDPDIFATPKCTSPYSENKCEQILRLSPNIEVPREYYALVPIDGYLLDKELNEQDELSNAFHTIIKTQDKDFKKLNKRSKPSSLSLSSSHTSHKLQHSSSCDITRLLLENSQNGKLEHYLSLSEKSSAFSDTVVSNCRYSFQTDSYCELLSDKVYEPAYSPDSLITDDPSSSSDYLSAAHTFSPGPGLTSCFSSLNVGENTTKMENVFTSSDSGFENTGMVESLNSNKDVTIADLSLTDTPHTYEASSNCANESTYWSLDSTEDSSRFKNNFHKNVRDLTCNKSSKEEKQRQNEEIVILESSSVSSETGSWESVFPPKVAEKEICEKFITNERIYSNQVGDKSKSSLPIFHHDKSLIQPPSCFIDAASLMDEENVSEENLNKDTLITASQPVPCSTINKDISPGDISESFDNEDSLEQTNNKDPDETHKDFSPTIFEMTLALEDHPNTTSEPSNDELHFSNKNDNTHKDSSLVMNATPNNSILSLKTSSLKNYESEESESDVPSNSKENLNVRLSRYNESSPIVSGGASIDGSIKFETQYNSPSSRRKVDNIPIVTGVFVENDNNTCSAQKPSKQLPASAWVIDMSSFTKTEEDKQPSNRCSKSRSSVDSDNSEKSTHKFYIDLSSLPDPLPPETSSNKEVVGDKKNIFSMYIDLDKSVTPKGKPRKLTSHIKKKQSDDSKENSSLTQTNDKPCKQLSNNSSPLNHTKSDKNTSFETYESLCNDLNISISEIISIPKKSNNATEIEISDTALSEKPENSQKDKKITSVILEEVEDDQQSDVFVRLSDLDKPVQKSEISSLFKNKKPLDDRMTRSIPENNWNESSHPSTSRSSEVITSFHSENAISLNRLFPHLKNEFSKSMPVSLSGKNQSKSGVLSSTGELEEQISDVSEMSSMQSSMLCSVIENSTTEETSHSTNIVGNSQFRLGQDLLRMFLEEIAPDVIVEVSGKRIKAHKCILSSRCQYFAGILSGGWVESAGNVIVLPPFSFNVVHFALCHIYSGLATIPDSISIVELATIADMLGLEGLKEAIMYTLKSKYCHHFHAPCPVCTAGVLECFPLSSVYGLDDLYRKCLKWITKHFSIVWPTKAFATLPKELLDKCYQEHLVNLKTETVIDTIYGCGITVASLQNSRWAESVAAMCRQLVNSVSHFVATHLSETFKIIATIEAEVSEAAKEALDDCLSASIEWASPDETCRAYDFLSNVVKEIKAQQILPIDENNSIMKVLTPNNILYKKASTWRLQCESALVRSAPRVVGIQAFKDLPADLRKRLRELGCIMYGPQVISPTSHSEKKCRNIMHCESTRHCSSKNRILDMEKVRNSFVPYKSKPVPVMRSLDELKTNTSQNIKTSTRKLPPKIKTTKAQEERAKFNQYKQQTLFNEKPAKTGNIYQNTKPRYLDVKVHRDKDKKSSSNKLLDLLPISSSESSRNSSPIKCRKRLSRLSTKPAGEIKIDMSEDSLASRPRTAEPSTDSLSESQTSNKYATYTKTKHIKGSAEQINATKYISPTQGQMKTRIPIYLKQKSVPGKGNCKANEIHKHNKPATESSLNLTANKSYPSTSNSGTLHEPRKTNSKSNMLNKLDKNIKTNSSDKKVSRSLMNATKSSSAKMVSKTTKEYQINKVPKQSKYSVKSAVKHGNDVTQTAELTQDEVVYELEIQDQQYFKNASALERSSTFSKDEPTFVDKAFSNDDNDL